MDKKKILIGVGLLVVVAGVGYYGYKKGLWLQKKEAAPAPLSAENLPRTAGATRVTNAAVKSPTLEKKIR